MSLKTYVYIWLLILLGLSFEFYALNFHPELSGLSKLKAQVPELKNLNLSPAPGKPISWYLGWAGFLIMCLTNLYTIRKRFGFLKKAGSLSGWLDFHILCGLVGPTFILFHTNFKIGGLVAISFWSMVVSFMSGIVGRYFYVQLVQQKSLLEKNVVMTNALINVQFKSSATSITEDVLERLKMENLRFVGGAALIDGNSVSLFGAMWGTLVGDMRMKFFSAPALKELPQTVNNSIRDYALKARRLGYLNQFQRLMGYWHSFHMPFAVFMYVVAVIHIAAALLFAT